MRLNFVPKTRLGKWSVGLGIAFVALMALSLLVAVAIGGDDAAVVAESPSLSILNVTLNLALNLVGLLSFLLGIFAVIKYKEWSVCKYLAVLYGLALLMFVLGEFLFLH